MNDCFPYIEEDLVYAVENCGADWNQEAVEALERNLYGPYSTGDSYTYCVINMKNAYYTDKQIEYAVNKIGW